MADQVEIQQSAQALDMVRSKLLALDEAFKKNYYTLDQYRKEHAALSREMRLAEKSFVSTVSTITDTVSAGRKLQDSTRFNALGFLYLSQAIEDAQYGFHSIVNNIPGMVMMFGGGPGLAGAVSIAAIGVNQLAKGFESFSRSVLATNPVPQLATDMEKFAEQSRKAGERLEELKKHKTLTDAELAEFNKLAAEKRNAEASAKEQGAFNAAASAPNEMAKARIAALQEAMKQVGGADAALGQMKGSGVLPKTKEAEDLMKSQIGIALETGSAAMFRDIQENAGATEFGERLKMALKGIIDVMDGTAEAIDEDSQRSQQKMQKRRAEIEAKTDQDLATWAKKIERDYGTGKMSLLDIRNQAYRRGIANGMTDEEADKFSAKFAKDAARNKQRAVEQIQAETGLGPDAAKKLYEDRLRGTSERYTGRHDRMMDAAAEQAGDGGAAMAGNRMLELVNNARFRRMHGAETRADALVAAAEVARRDVYHAARRGGMGAEQASLFADQSVSQSFNQARDMIDAMAAQNPITQKELATNMSINNKLLQDHIVELRKGIRAQWSTK